MAPSIVIQASDQREHSFIQTFTDVLGSALRNKSSSPVICPSVRQPALNTTPPLGKTIPLSLPFPNSKRSTPVASLAQAKI
ncbi:hypothetical protein HBI60_016080 [Parastagonospora nodorum]|nr:hypothetical protein HBI76_000580 [Parastagonospora nodorum]KAH6019004.1 hypothetical protein HBI83_114410 [Parastagonospora nodorum]KAH6406520.1 hypothetical protein HBI60_016080 [Parastagonospora nodorum]